MPLTRAPPLPAEESTVLVQEYRERSACCSGLFPSTIGVCTLEASQLLAFLIEITHASHCTFL